MIVQQSEKFAKLLDGMRNGGGNAALAARNADQVIAGLRKVGEDEFFEVGRRRTKYGEKRIKNCLKFNLGNGYRLISVRMTGGVRLLYLGSHDECHAWLERNRGRFFGGATAEQGFSAARSPAGGGAEAAGPGPEGDEYEEALSRKLDDRILRVVFRGLLKSANRQQC